MRIKFFVTVFFAIFLLLSRCQSAFADDSSDLEKILNDIKLGNELGKFEYIYLTTPKNSDVKLHEGQVGNLQVKVYTIKSHQTDIVWHVIIELEGKKQSSWISVITAKLDKPTEKKTNSSETSISFNGSDYNWSLYLHNPSRYNHQELTSFVYHRNPSIFQKYKL